jgi:tetratricopeptide (TPR) repeat protein
VRELLEQALRGVSDRDPRVRAALLARRAQIGRELPLAERLAMLEEADALASSSASDDLQLEIATCRASLRDPSQLEHNALAARKLRVLLAQQSPKRFEIRMRAFAGIMTEYLCALTSCELEAADAVVRRATELAGPEDVAALQPVQTRLLVRLMMAGRALGDGRFEDLQRDITALRELCTLLSGQASLAWVMYTCLLSEARGDRQILLNLTSVSPPPMQAAQTRQNLYSAIFKTWIYAKAGREDDARESLASISGAELARMPAEYGDLGLLCMLTEVHQTLGQIDGAEQLYHQLVPHAALNAVGPCLEYRGSVAYYVGVLAAMLGNADEAVRSAERARAVNARLKMPVHLARTQTFLKDVAARRS